MPSSVTPIAHVVCSKAEEDSHGAAIHALPVNLGLSMSLTDVLASTDLLQDTILAEQILRLGLRLLILLLHFLLTVDKPSKVRLFAPVALIEGAPVVRILLHSAKIEVTFRRQTLIVENALFVSMSQSLCFNFLLETYEGSELGRDRRRKTPHCDGLLAAGT